MILIEATWRLRTEGMEFELTIVGDGPLRPQIEQMVHHFDLDRHVHLVGWQSNASVRELVRDARAMVLPSFAEGLPVVLIEAMALRRPVISTHVAGIPELVEPGVTGWLVPAGSVEKLAVAVRHCLEALPEQLAEMGRAGFMKVAEYHNVETEAKKLADLFRHAAGRADVPTSTFASDRRAAITSKSNRPGKGGINNK